MSSNASASSLTTGIDEPMARADEPREPDGGHQPARAVGGLVAPDRQAAVQVRQADRQVEHGGAGGLAGLQRDRLAATSATIVPSTPIGERGSGGRSWPDSDTPRDDRPARRG